MNRLEWDSRQAIFREDEGPETEELRPDIGDAACERVVAKIKVLHGTQTTSCVMDPHVIAIRCTRLSRYRCCYAMWH